MIFFDFIIAFVAGKSDFFYPKFNKPYKYNLFIMKTFYKLQKITHARNL